jgi:predicted nucleic acid-binding protein
MRQTIIIDTSALVALINPNDPHHQWAVEQWSKIYPPVLTCEAVISETCFLLRRVHLIEAVFGTIETQAIAIDFNLQKEAFDVRQLMKRYESVPMSFADACLVRMSEKWVNSAVFTLGSDFSIYRRDRNSLIPLISNFR